MTEDTTCHTPAASPSQRTVNWQTRVVDCVLDAFDMLGRGLGPLLVTVLYALITGIAAVYFLDVHPIGQLVGLRAAFSSPDGIPSVSVTFLGLYLVATSVYMHYRASTTHPGQVPAWMRRVTEQSDRADWNPRLQKMVRCLRWDPELYRSSPDAPWYRLCDICHNVKGMRTHHCSVCQCCVLKMDHHCPWIRGCVGFHNLQFFLLFLLHFPLLCLFFVLAATHRATSAAPYTPAQLGWSAGFHALDSAELYRVFAAYLIATVGVGVSGAMAVWSWALCCLNVSTIEAYTHVGNAVGDGVARVRAWCCRTPSRSSRPPDHTAAGTTGKRRRHRYSCSFYSMGLVRNVHEVFGVTSWWSLLLCLVCPIVFAGRRRVGNGIIFPIRPPHTHTGIRGVIAGLWAPTRVHKQRAALQAEGKSCAGAGKVGADGGSPTFLPSRRESKLVQRLCEGKGERDGGVGVCLSRTGQGVNASRQGRWSANSEGQEVLTRRRGGGLRRRNSVSDDR